MNSIITDNSNAEHAISSKTDTFFPVFSISKLMKKSNFYKEGGIQCVVVLNSSSYNWARLLLLLVTIIIDGINRLTSEDRVSVLIVDDSLILALPVVWKQKLKLSA